MHNIEVNGSTLSVGHNLYMFMHAHREQQRGDRPRNGRDQEYRSTHPTLSLWIDAIFINRSNTEEKKYQVGEMGQIHKSAQQILIWLGELGEHMQRFLTEIDALTLVLDESDKNNGKITSNISVEVERMDKVARSHVHN
jgi:hypothetical protein